MNQIFRYLLLPVLFFIGKVTSAQELYIHSMPASNIPANSLAFRLSNEITDASGIRNRSSTDVAIGINARLMGRLAFFASNFQDRSYRPESLSLYMQYRFLSYDEPQYHLRMAAFGRLGGSRNPLYPSQEMHLNGNNSGGEAGVTLTQLIRKLAISVSGSLSHFTSNLNHDFDDSELHRNVLNYNVSAGYLLLPRIYESYDQVNLNLYLEFLGKQQFQSDENSPETLSMLDIAPGIQFIFNSVTRLDLSVRHSLAGDMNRPSQTYYFLRLEHNLFSVL